MREIRWAFDCSTLADSGQSHGAVEGLMGVLLMKRHKEQKEQVEGKRLTRQAAAIDERRGGDGSCQDKNIGLTEQHEKR